MTRIDRMKHYWRVFPLFTTTLRLILTAPYNLRQARVNVWLWAVTTFCATVAFGLSVVYGWWWGFHALILFFDAAMLKWAIIGLVRMKIVQHEQQQAAEDRKRFDRIIRGLR